ncbi:MAG: high-potential iron-sulfur protein [Adhaeribacter sp.]
MEDTQYSRRKFILHSVYAGGALLTGSWLFAGCKPAQAPVAASAPASPPATSPATPQPPASPAPAAPGQASTPAAEPCDDLTGVAASEIDKRKKFAYVNVSPIADSKCGNCSLYIPPASGKACGGCMLFKGPVRASGYCTYWAPIS